MDHWPDRTVHEVDFGSDRVGPAAAAPLKQRVLSLAWWLARRVPWYLWLMLALFLYGRYVQGNGKRVTRARRSVFFSTANFRLDACARRRAQQRTSLASCAIAKALTGAQGCAHPTACACSNSALSSTPSLTSSRTSTQAPGPDSRAEPSPLRPAKA